MKTNHILTCLLAASATLPATHGVIILGGTHNGNIATALTALGESFTVDGAMNPDPAVHSLGAGDFIITSSDGGAGPFIDYTPFLNAGGHVIVVGGSNFQPYRDWAALYFNLTDTGSGWHTDGDWHVSSSGVSSSSYVPDDYEFEGNSATFHMLGFLPGPSTVLYGVNDEGINVAAFRSYANGGSIDYMALDLGPVGYSTANDIANFTVPWLRGALEASVVDTVPEAASGFILLGLGVGALTVFRRK